MFLVYYIRKLFIIILFLLIFFLFFFCSNESNYTFLMRVKNSFSFIIIFF